LRNYKCTAQTVTAGAAAQILPGLFQRVVEIKTRSFQGWNHAKDDPGKQSQSEREKENCEIHRHVTRIEQTCGAQRD
jgi:hypothetical protein